MKKLLLVLALGLVLAACAGESRVIMVTATPVPATATPAPPTVEPTEESYTLTGMNKHFIDYFADRGFEDMNERFGYIEFTRQAGRGVLMVGITDNDDGHNPVFGFIGRINAFPEERDLILAHLSEAAEVVDPVDGLDIANAGMLKITTNTMAIGPDGTLRTMWADGETWSQFIHTSTGQEVYIHYLYEEENLIKVFFTYLPVGWQHPTE